MSAVELRDLFRVYSTPEGDAAALQGLSLDVKERELVAILGPSGSGKTALLRTVAGLDRPSAGRIRVFGIDLAGLTERQLGAYRAELLGYADQHYGAMLASELPARSLVALQLALRGTPRLQRLARADQLLERVGLHDRREARPHELSGGEQQRVAVCAALAHRPRLLLADEPTGELDAVNARHLFDLLAELVREEGTTMLLVSHDPGSADLADRIVTIRDGRVAGESVRVEGSGGEAIVVGRGGWLRLPEEYMRRAGIRSRATARLEKDEIVVRAAEPGVVQQGASRPPADPPRLLPVVAQATALTKTYRGGGVERPVLHALDATFRGGRLCAVTGPSGSGKTTLLHLLAGLEQPTAGDVVVEGTALSSMDREARAAFRAQRIAFVGQEPGLTPFLSAQENVELGLALHGDAYDESVRRGREALEAVGLSERATQRVSRLSSGERERVAIARAVVRLCPLILVDEPTSRLDEANALSVAALLARLARETGAAVVCATHDPLLIEQADEELGLGDGLARGLDGADERALVSLD